MDLQRKCPKEAKLASIPVMKRAIKPKNPVQSPEKTNEALNGPTRLDLWPAIKSQHLL